MPVVFFLNDLLRDIEGTITAKLNFQTAKYLITFYLSKMKTGR